MLKLIYFEFRKITSQKIFLVFLALLLVLNAVFVYREVKDSKIQSEKDIAAFIEEYKKDPEAMEKYMADFTEVYYASLKNPSLTSPKSIYSDADAVLFTSFAGIRDLNDTYAALLAKAKKTSSGMLMEYEYLGYAKNSFEVVYQTSVLDSYSELDSLSFPLENVIGFDLFFEYNGFCVFLLLAVLLLGIRLVSEEQNAGMLMILRTTDRGRNETVLSKIVVGFCMTSLLCILFLGSTLFMLSLRIGLYGWHLPIQMIDHMRLCPLAITVGEGILLSLLAQIFTAFTFFVVVFLIAILFKNMLAVFTSVVAFIGANFAIANYNFFNGYSFFKNINLFWCLDGTRLLSVWRGVRLFDRCFSLIPLWLVLYGGIAVVAGILAMVLFANGKTVRRSVRKLHFRFPLHLKKKTRYTTGIYRFEVKKICSVVTGIVVLASVLLTVYLSDDAYHLQRDFDMNYYSEYMERMEGEWTEEKHQTILSEYREMSEITGKYEPMREKYSLGLITSNEYNRYLMEYLDAEVRIRTMKRIAARSEYLKTKYEEGYSVAFFDDTGWNLLTDANLSFVMCLAVIMICADIFAMEHRSGFFKIQSATEKGRLPVGIAKFAVAVTVAVVLGLISEACQFIYVGVCSGLDGASYSAISMEMESTLSVGGYFACSMLKNMMLYSMLAGVTAGISKLTRRMIPTLVVMAVVVFSPMIFSYFGISLFDQVSFLNLFMR